MIVSEARIAANRENGLKSRGPKTEAGKARSRANALTHGLTATVVLPEEGCRIVEERKKDWSETFGSNEGYKAWVADQVAGLTWKIDQADRIEVELRGKQVVRAGICWEDDRRLEAEILGSKLAMAPAEGVQRLKATSHGCEWMITRWAMLAQVAESLRPWTEDHLSLAFDLLGTPHEFRDRCVPGKQIDSDGQFLAHAERPINLARSQILALKARRDDLEELDELDQAMARADLADESLPELRRLRRYQGALHRQLRWTLAQLKEDAPTPPKTLYISAPPPQHDPEPQPQLPEPEPTLEPEPEPESTVEPELESEPKVEPESESEPKVEVQPRTISPRQAQREAKVEARREAKRRKLGRLMV